MPVSDAEAVPEKLHFGLSSVDARHRSAGPIQAAARVGRHRIGPDRLTACDLALSPLYRERPVTITFAGKADNHRTGIPDRRCQPAGQRG